MQMSQNKLLYCASTNRHLKHFHMPYIEMLKDLNIQVDILSSGSSDDFPTHVFYHVPFTKSITSPKNLSCIKQIRQIIKKGNYKYIVLNTALTAALVRLSVPFYLRKKMTIINISHGYFFGQTVPFKRNFIFSSVEKTLKNKTDYIITMNEEDFDYAETLRLSKSGVFFVHGMGYNSNKFFFTKHTPKKEGQISLFYAAEHSDRKNHAELLYAVADAIENGANLVLTLAGDGDLLEHNQKLCKTLKISDRVHFLGYIENISDEYKNHDYVVSPSKIEGLPFNIMEALATGLPCIVSEVKGHVDLVKDGYNGFIYPLGSWESLSEILCGLTNSESGYKALSKNAAESVLEYQIEYTKKEFNQIYKSILK